MKRKLFHFSANVKTSLADDEQWISFRSLSNCCASIYEWILLSDYVSNVQQTLDKWCLFLPFSSQTRPLNPFTQVHVKLEPSRTQVEPFLHGELSHAFAKRKTDQKLTDNLIYIELFNCINLSQQIAKKLESNEEFQKQAVFNGN